MVACARRAERAFDRSMPLLRSPGPWRRWTARRRPSPTPRTARARTSPSTTPTGATTPTTGASLRPRVPAPALPRARSPDDPAPRPLQNGHWVFLLSALSSNVGTCHDPNRLVLCLGGGPRRRILDRGAGAGRARALYARKQLPIRCHGGGGARRSQPCVHRGHQTESPESPESFESPESRG